MSSPWPVVGPVLRLGLFNGPVFILPCMRFIHSIPNSGLTVFLLPVVDTIQYSPVKLSGLTLPVLLVLLLIVSF